MTQLVDQHGRPVRYVAPSREQLRETPLEEMQTFAVTSGAAELIEILKEDSADWYDASYTNGVLPDRTRRQIENKARLGAIVGGTEKQIVQLYRNFAVGSGIQFTPTPESTIGPKAKQVWSARRNRHAFSIVGQRRISDTLTISGNWFVSVFGRQVAATVRTMDSRQIVEIVADPDDAAEALWYLQSSNEGGRQIKNRWPALYANPARLRETETDPRIANRIRGYNQVENAVVYHLALDSIEPWGNSVLTTVMEYTRSKRKLLRYYLAKFLAHAMFAFKQKLSHGTASDVSAATEFFQSGLVAGDRENNPPPAPGGVHVENAGSDLSPIRTDSGTGEAQMGAALLTQEAGAGPGFFAQYLGYGESFRLATATAMELPVLTMLLCFQSLLVNAFKEIFEYVFELDESSAEESGLAWQPPEIIQASEAMITAIAGAVASLQWGESDEVMARLLALLEVGNLPKAIEELKAAGAVRQARADAIAAQIAATGGGESNGDDDGGDDEFSEADVAAVVRLARIRNRMEFAGRGGNGHAHE